jgi:hypothetical protein
MDNTIDAMNDRLGIHREKACVKAAWIARGRDFARNQVEHRKVRVVSVSGKFAPGRSQRYWKVIAPRADQQARFLECLPDRRQRKGTRF